MYCYSYSERFDPSCHGENTNSKLQLEGKWIPLISKNKNESVQDFESIVDINFSHMMTTPHRTTLNYIVQQGEYYFSLDKTCLIRKFQRLFRAYRQKRRNKYNVKRLYSRQVGIVGGGDRYVKHISL